MKNLLPFPLIFILFTGQFAFGQTVSLNRRNASLDYMLNAIKEQTGYGNFVVGTAREHAKPVDFNEVNVPLDSILTKFCRNQPLAYSITDRTIIITYIPRSPQSPAATKSYIITGRIVSESGEPVPGATITIINGTQSAISNNAGEFSITCGNANSTLMVTSVNYEPREVPLDGQPVIDIRMRPHAGELEPVVVSTGYQNFSKDENPGSFSKIDNELFNRRVSTNILDRLDGVTAGMIFNKNIAPGLNQSTMNIRGRSTIFSNAEPLIVVDNFPYPGDINNINPNDVENITILKDANAAAIWGAFAGNGVIVINTKKGRFNQEPRLTLNSNITFGGKPDAYYLPALNSTDYISVEQYLFENGYYAGLEASPVPVAFSPAVELLIRKRDGLINDAMLNAGLDSLRALDVRREREKYFYRNSVNQQYAISTSGGGANNHYYMSVGYDRNWHNLVANKSQRLTVTVNNTYSWFKDKLELNTGIAYSESKRTGNNSNYLPVIYPYMTLSKNAPAYYEIRQSFKDQAKDAGLLDWTYRPFEEIYLADITKRIADFRMSVNAKLKIAKGLSAKILYQYNKGKLEDENYRSAKTYFTRDLINRFTQVDSFGRFTYPIPKDKGISDQTKETYKAQNFRLQLNYSRSWTDRHNRKHAITALAGAEVRDICATKEERRLYGYQKGLSAGVKIDTSTEFPQYHVPSLKAPIPNPTQNLETTDRYISFYATASYTWQQRYTISASARKDESNLFGVRTNQKGVPLYSLGVSWKISSEKFYRLPWLPQLKLRVTHGYNGNVNKSVSAYTTASLSNGTNVYGASVGSIINPPNPDLRWEKIQITNIGLDFVTAKEIVSGSLEYYQKRGTDLIGNGPLDPTTGNVQFRGNVAAMEGSGFDIMITTKNLNRLLKWHTTILFNQSVDKVTSYEIQQPTIASYYNPTLLNPLENRPLFSVYSLRWLGLDKQTGNPIGSLDGVSSQNYTAIVKSSNFDDLVYSGPANPTTFGSIRNSFSWKQLSLSLNITWKAGYYFRRNSIDYNELFIGRSPGHPDFALRWQKPGDEIGTDIPSLVYPLNSDRNTLFKYSEILVEKGDHIRLQDIQFSYDINRSQFKKLPMKLIRLYVYANNLGILWKANKKDIDPDYVSSIPNPKSIAIGIKLEF